MPVVIHCRKCGEVKDKIEKNGTRRCTKCRKAEVKERLDKKRAEQGLPPVWRGGGRSPLCYECGAVKENPKVGYCYACKRKQDNEWRLNTGRTKRHLTGKCRCGNEFASYSRYLCVDCYRKKRHERRNDPNYSEVVLKERVRSLTRMYIKMGTLVKENCTICGTNENIEAHHEDYTKPLEVMWLCRKDHRKLHKEKESKNERK